VWRELERAAGAAGVGHIGTHAFRHTYRSWPLHAGDFRGLHLVASDPLIWEQHPVNDRWKEDVFKKFFQESLDSGGALIAIDSRNGHMIGSSRFHGYDKEKSEVEIGWTFLARSHWGGIYNREMKELMLRHAFAFVDRVYFL